VRPAATVGRERYEVERTLGRGGMATVYLAHDSMLERPIALKVLDEELARDESFRTRLLREARLAARVQHPNVVQVYDAGSDGPTLYIAMECVDGESLAAELARRGRLSAADATDVGVQLAAALEAAHAAGLVHRDVKPANVLRSRELRVKLGDFGVARQLDATALTEHGAVLGTAAYLSPEQARGEAVTGAADIYALGVVLYESLTGRRPHEGSSLAEFVLAREREPVVPPGALVSGVPARLESAILACLALRPEDRPTAAALGAELAGGAPDATAETVVVAPPRSARRRRRLVPILALLAAVAAGIAVAVVATEGPGGSPRKTRTPTLRATPPPPPPPAARTVVPVVHRTPPPPAASAPAHRGGHPKKAKHKPPHQKHHGHGPKHGPKHRHGHK
jgi:serine/threonine-protein kinase